MEGTSGCPVISWIRANAGNPSPALCIIQSSPGDPVSPLSGRSHPEVLPLFLSQAW